MPGGDTRLAPLEGDPFSEGFVCACNQGRGGLLCEGRQVNVTVGESAAPGVGWGAVGGLVDGLAWLRRGVLALLVV